MTDHGEQGTEPSLPLSGMLTPEGHHHRVRVYYADTDFSGVVYHARYLEFLERGRSDFLRLAGVQHTALAAGAHGERLVWVVRRMEIDFKASARIDDILSIDTVTESVSGARIFMRQTISRNGVVLIGAKVEAAIVSADGRPRRFPKEWLAAFLPGRQAPS